MKPTCTKQWLLFSLALGLTFLAHAAGAQTYNYGGANVSDDDGIYSVSYRFSSYDFVGLYESKNNGSKVRIATSASGTVSRFNSPGTYRYYVMRRICVGFPATNCSEQMSSVGLQVHVLTPQPPTSAPSFSGSNIQTTFGSNQGTLSIDWSAVVKADRYWLQERVGSSWITRQDTSARSKSFINRALGEYEFRVRACNNHGCDDEWRTRRYGLTREYGSDETSISGAHHARGDFVLDFTSQQRDYVQIEQSGNLVESHWTPSSKTFSLANGTYRFRVNNCAEFLGSNYCSGFAGPHTVEVLRVPGTPSTLTTPSQHGNPSMGVSWSAASGAVHEYLLQYKKSTTSQWQEETFNSSTRSATLSVSEGVYNVRVAACNTLDGSRSCSAWRSGTNADVSRPKTAPTLTLAASNTSGQYTVQWDGISNTAYYTVHERVNDSAWSTLRDGSLNRSSSTTINRNGSNNAFTYRVSACNSFGCSSFSPEKTILVALPPGTPGTITAPSVSSLQISWGASTGDLSDYRLRYRRSGASWTEQILRTRSTTISPPPDGRYEFLVRACKTVQTFTSCSSERRIADIDLYRPQQSPDIALQAPAANNTIRVHWPSVAYASHYRVEEIRDSGNPTTWDTSGRETLRDVPSGLYQYRVWACNALACSSSSARESLEWRKSATGAVSVRTRNNTLTDIHDLAWSAMSGASYYELSISDGNGNSDRRRVDGRTYALSGLYLGENDVRLFACDASGNCNQSIDVGTFLTQEKIRFIHADLLGSPAIETDEAGNVTARHRYKPFGETQAEPKEDIGYTGHIEDPDLGLTYMQARYYDPVIGRFYSNDPVGFLGHIQRGNSPAHGFNRYAYANNNPYKYVDPDGRAGKLINAGVKLIKHGGNPKKAGKEFVADVVDSATTLLDPNSSALDKAEAVFNLVSPVSTKDAKGLLPKPPTGPGSVPKSERDPKRLFTSSERSTKREEQGGKCANGCGTDIDASNSAGHHIERHADGGRTVPENHAEVCKECHLDLHRKDS